MQNRRLYERFETKDDERDLYCLLMQKDQAVSDVVGMTREGCKCNNHQEECA